MRLEVNGAAHEVDADPDTPLLWAIRDLVGLTGTKFGCGRGLCGACTVWLDGTPARSCLTRLDAVAGRKVTTIEAVGATPAGAAAQQAWLDLQVVQCGYCQSGQIMSAAALLARNAAPSDADIDAAMSGNVCRCGTYLRLRAAIHLAAGALRQAGETPALRAQITEQARVGKARSAGVSPAGALAATPSAGGTGKEDAGGTPALRAKTTEQLRDGKARSAGVSPAGARG